MRRIAGAKVLHFSILAKRKTFYFRLFDQKVVFRGRVQGFFRTFAPVMMEKTRGIVLRTIRYSDAALIADIYTESRGTLGFLVRVPRSRKSVIRNVLLSPLTLLELEIDYRENRKLQRLVDVRVDEPYRSVPYEPVKETIAKDFMSMQKYVRILHARSFMTFTATPWISQPGTTMSFIAGFSGCSRTHFFPASG